jgi:hypothetical protein
MAESRSRFLMGTGIVLLLIGVAVAYHYWMRCPIRYDQFDRIENGMHLSEVEALLGCPPADYRRGEIEYVLDDLLFPLEFEEARWQGDQGDVMIFHDHNKLVVGKNWVKGEPESFKTIAMHWFIERLRRN